MKIGCHLSASGGYLAMGQTAVSIGANVFQFFTRNPRGGAAKPLDKGDVAAFLDFAAANGIGPILAHAPYTLNAAGAEPRVREFAEEVMSDDLDRLEHTPGAMYNFHPGSHVGQGAEEGINLISGMVSRILLRWLDAHGGKLPSTTILLETMSGKGSEVGRDFAEIRAIIDRTESRLSPVPHSHPSSDRLRGSLRSGDTFPSIGANTTKALPPTGRLSSTSVLPSGMASPATTLRVVVTGSQISTARPSHDAFKATFPFPSPTTKNQSASPSRRCVVVNCALSSLR